jgi:hypothetical protein
MDRRGSGPASPFAPQAAATPVVDPAQPAASLDPEKKPGGAAETSVAGTRARHRLQPHILQPTRGKPPPQFTRWIQAKGHSPARVPAERTECPYLVRWLNQRQWEFERS